MNKFTYLVFLTWVSKSLGASVIARAQSNHYLITIEADEEIFHDFLLAYKNDSYAQEESEQLAPNVDYDTCKYFVLTFCTLESWIL